MKIIVLDEFIKIGQWFRGNINGEKFKIIDITKGLKKDPYKIQQSPTQQKNIYIYIQDEAGRISHTNKEHFKRLLITPIQGGQNVKARF